MLEYRFSLTGIFSYMDEIVDSVLKGNTGMIKPGFVAYFTVLCDYDFYNRKLELSWLSLLHRHNFCHNF